MESIEQYVGTMEESALQNVLRCILLDTDMPLCSNAVLEYCNSWKACSFSNADVTLQTYEDILSCGSHGTALETWSTFIQSPFEYTNICFDQLFKTDLLRQVASDGLELIKKHKDVKVFHGLLDFLHDLERHQSALETVRTSTDEASAMVVLAEHLFSRLIPGHNYILDDSFKGLPKHCPCNCKSEVKKGCTAIGSSFTWHGYADIFLDQKIAVSILKESKYEENYEKTGFEPPPFKKVCCDEEKTQDRLCVDNIINSDSVNEQNLMNIKTVDQIVAECITNAFAQVSKSESLSGWLIPTFSCTTEDVMVFLYDPVNDILLHCIQVIPLWKSDVINMMSVVKIWMFLNFCIFTERNLSDKYELKKSTFHQCAERHLGSYKKIECQKPLKCVKTDFYQKEIMPILLKGAKASYKLCATSRGGASQKK